MMNKMKFLARLQERIDMLDDVEQKDILDEYAQHIDMKVENGMTEAEAINDFGPMDDLVAEILSAYHVKVPEAKPNAHPGLDDLKENGLNAAEKAVDATKRGFSKLSGAASGLLGKAKNTSKHAASAVGVTQATAGAGAGVAGVGVAGAGNASFTGAGANAGVANASAGVVGGVSKAAHAGVEGIGKLFQGVKNGSVSIGAFCFKVLTTGIRWFWNFLVACFGICALLFALIAMFGFGLSLVLAIQGYPAIGIAVFALGALLCLGGIGTLVFKLIVLKPKTGGIESGKVAQRGFSATASDNTPASGTAFATAPTNAPFSPAGDTAPLPTIPLPTTPLTNGTDATAPLPTAPLSQEGARHA